MLKSINDAYNRAKKAQRDNAAILESVLSVEEVLPGSDDEFEDIVDIGSVPEEAYNKVDALLDKIVSNPNYDDTEAEELVDGEDVDEDEIDDAELDAIVDEAVDSVPEDAWEDDECIGHPLKPNNANDTRQQPEFEDDGQKGL